MMWNSIARPSLALLAALALVSCSKQDDTQTPEPATQNTPAQALASVPKGIEVNEASNSMWLRLEADIEACHSAIESLHSQTKLLLDSDGEPSLGEAQQAWSEAESRIVALDFLFRLAQSTPKHLDAIAQLDYLISATPIQPGYLDSFGDYPYSGLVHDIGTPIDRDTLLQQHGLTDSEEVLLGIYAIEYILFGENGSRSSEDFVRQTELSAQDKANGLQSINEASNNRRRVLLSTQAALLLEHSQQLVRLTRRDSDIRVQPVWRQQSQYQQWHSAREAFKRSVAQSLIDLVELRIDVSPVQTEDAQPLAENDLPAAIDEIPNVNSRARKIALKLSGSEAVLEFLEKDARKQTREALQQAQDQLAAMHNYTDVESHNQKVQLAYEALSSIEL
jgi:putative iron-regulated protein